MANLIRMDLYRMVKAKSFLVCLLVTFGLALSGAPLAWLLARFAASFATQGVPFATQTNLSVILGDPFPMLGLMITLLSLCWFFHADVEHGYIKNIAGQVPMKGLAVLSRFIAAFVHNAAFAAASILGNLIGALLVLRVVPDSQVADSLRLLVLRLLLAQSLSAVLLLAVTTFRSKALGMTLAVVFGLGLTPLIYMGINSGLSQLMGPGTDISTIMPDTVMYEMPLDTLKALAVAAGWGALFLVPAIRIFDRKDVK